MASSATPRDRDGMENVASLLRDALLCIKSKTAIIVGSGSNASGSSATGRPRPNPTASAIQQDFSRAFPNLGGGGKRFQPQPRLVLAVVEIVNNQRLSCSSRGKHGHMIFAYHKKKLKFYTHISKYI
eukprot:gene2147-2443_t